MCTMPARRCGWEREGGRREGKTGELKRRQGGGGEREREKGEKPQGNYWPDEVLTSGNAIDKGSVRTSRKRETKNRRRRNRSSEASKKRGHEYGWPNFSVEKSGGVVVTRRGEEGTVEHESIPVHVIRTSNCDGKNKKITKNRRLKISRKKFTYFRHFLSPLVRDLHSFL